MGEKRTTSDMAVIEYQNKVLLTIGCPPVSLISRVWPML